MDNIRYLDHCYDIVNENVKSQAEIYLPEDSNHEEMIITGQTSEHVREINYLINPSTSSTSASNKWTAAKIHLLLDLRLGMEEQFVNAAVPKKILWEIIREKFAERGFAESRQDLYDKYRNLIQTYRANKKKRIEDGSAAISWEFFNKFEAIYGCSGPEESNSINKADDMNSTRTTSGEGLFKKQNTTSQHCDCHKNRSEKNVHSKDNIFNLDKSKDTLFQYFYLREFNREIRKIERRKRKKQKSLANRIYRENKLKLMETQISLLQQLVNTLSGTENRN